MRISNRGKVLLVGACLLAGSVVWAQQSQKPVKQVSTDLAFTFAFERAQIVPNVCCFWLKGAGADASFNLWKGLGAAVALNSGTAVNVEPGVDMNKISFLAGPRYTRTAWQGHATAADNRRLQVFGQGLFGRTHGFNGYYPAMPAATSSAGSLAIQAGGGLNFYLTRNFGLRLLEADYVRTELPNSTSGVQNDLRLSAGVTWHIGRR